MSNWFWYLGFSAELVFWTSVERQKKEEVIILKICPFESAKLFILAFSDTNRLLQFAWITLLYDNKKEIYKFAVLDVH